MRLARLIIIGLAVLLAGASLADDTTIKVLGAGSATGTVLGATPAATGVGKWLQATGGVTDSTFWTFQLSGAASATIVIQTSMDGVKIDTPKTLVEGEIYAIANAGGTVYRAVCTAFTSGSPIVTASVSGKAQVTVLQ